jgi:hypothetical protein
MTKPNRLGGLLPFFQMCEKYRTLSQLETTFNREEFTMTMASKMKALAAAMILSLGVVLMASGQSRAGFLASSSFSQGRDCDGSGHGGYGGHRGRQSFSATCLR